MAFSQSMLPIEMRCDSSLLKFDVAVRAWTVDRGAQNWTQNRFEPKSFVLNKLYINENTRILNQQ